MCEAQFSHRAQKKSLELAISHVQRIVQTALEAERADLAGEPHHRLLVLLTLADPQRDPHPLAGFGVDYFDIALESMPLKLTTPKNLHGSEVHRCCQEQTEPFSHRVEHHQKIGDDEDLPCAPNGKHLAGEDLREVVLSTRRDLAKLARQLHNSMTSVHECGCQPAVTAEHPNHYAVARSQRDVSERQRGCHRVLKLAVTRRIGHRCAGIEEYVRQQVFFFLEQLDV